MNPTTTEAPQEQSAQVVLVDEVCDLTRTPAREDLDRLTVKRDELSARVEATESEIRRLAPALAAMTSETERLRQAKLLIDGSAETETVALRDALERQREALAVLTDAQSFICQQIADARRRYTEELLVAFRPNRAAIVARMAEALRVLLTAADEDQQLAAEIGTLSGESRCIPRVAFLWASGECDAAERWFAARRAEGFEV